MLLPGWFASGCHKMQAGVSWPSEGGPASWGFCFRGWLLPASLKGMLLLRGQLALQCTKGGAKADLARAQDARRHVVAFGTAADGAAAGNPGRGLAEILRSYVVPNRVDWDWGGVSPGEGPRERGEGGTSSG